jgi:hypothetical protein
MRHLHLPAAAWTAGGRPQTAAPATPEYRAPRPASNRTGRALPAPTSYPPNTGPVAIICGVEGLYGLLLKL